MIEKPRLVLDKEIVFRNSSRISKKVQQNAKHFQPHFKTHQSIEVGKWIRNLGVTDITVSSMDMLAYFIQDDWDSFLLALPLHPGLFKSINQVNNECNLKVLSSSIEHLKYLNNILDKPLQVLLDIDRNYGRTGMPIDQLSDISEFPKAIQHLSKIGLIGCYIHAGNSYQQPNKESILAFSDGLMASITQLKKTLNLPIYYGDTPTCSLMEDFSVIDVLTPGNLFFYDLSQEHIGSCQQEDIAVWVDCPIIEVKARNALDIPTHVTQSGDKEFAQIVIHGGSVHFSKDHLDIDGRIVYGRLKDKPSLYLDKISQEHGLIIGPKDLIFEVADQSYLSIYPVHSCLTAESMGGYTDSKTFTCYDHMKGNR